MFALSSLANLRIWGALPIRTFNSSTVVSYPKLKTHSGTKKRWTALPSGKYKRAKAGKSHLNSPLSRSTLRGLGKPAYANSAQAGMLRQLLPYG